MLQANEIIRSVAETVRGTTPGTPSWFQHDIHGAGLRIQESRAVWEGFFASTFPDLTRTKKTAHRAEGSMTTPIFPLSMQQVLEMGYKRTSGVLDSFTFHRKKGTIGDDVGYLGCVCDQLELSFDAGEEPVIASFDWVAMAVDTTPGAITAGTYPAGAPLMGHETTVSIGGVDFTTYFESGRITVANNLIRGPVGTDGFLKWIKDGTQRYSVELTHSLESDDVKDILRGTAITPIIIVLATGIGTEKVTLTLPEAEIMEAPENVSDVGEDEKEVLTAVCRKPSAAALAQWVYSTT